MSHSRVQGRRPAVEPARSTLAVGWLASLGLLLGGPCAAGPWEATTGPGLTVRIKQDSYRARDAYVLERQYPDGSLDASFGQQGSILFTLGPDNEGPTSLRLDAHGRAWVAGASTQAGNTSSAVILRYLSHGVLDASWGDGGRSATSPGGRSARALDIAPQVDGGAIVIGTVVDGSGQERTGWWRLRADGKVDLRFGLGGLWADAGSGSTEPVDLVTGHDGSVALVLQRADARTNQMEAWVLMPGHHSPALSGRAEQDPARRLVWRHGGWRWVDGASLLDSSAQAVAPSASAADGSPDSDAARAKRHVVPPNAVTASPAQTAHPAASTSAARSRVDLVTWVNLLLIAGLIAAAIVAWLRHRSRAPDRR